MNVASNVPAIAAHCFGIPGMSTRGNHMLMSSARHPRRDIRPPPSDLRRYSGRKPTCTEIRYRNAKSTVNLNKNLEKTTKADEVWGNERKRGPVHNDVVPKDDDEYTER